MINKSMLRIFSVSALLAAGLAYLVAPVSHSDAATSEPPLSQAPPSEHVSENMSEQIKLSENLTKQIKLLHDLVDIYKKENAVLNRENGGLKRALNITAQHESKDEK